MKYKIGDIVIRTIDNYTSITGDDHYSRIGDVAEITSKAIHNKDSYCVKILGNGMRVQQIKSAVAVWDEDKCSPASKLHKALF